MGRIFKRYKNELFVLGIRVTSKRLDTLLDITAHVIVSAGLAGFLYFLTGTWLWPLLGVAGGILIDIDHLVDHFMHFGGKFRVKDFFDYKYLVSGKTYVPLHSWEVLVILWGLSLRFVWVVPLVSGMTLHLFIDCFLSHRSDPLFFSLVFRGMRGFDSDKVSKDIKAMRKRRKRA